MRCFFVLCLYCVCVELLFVVLCSICVFVFVRLLSVVVIVLMFDSICVYNAFIRFVRCHPLFGTRLFYVVVLFVYVFVGPFQIVCVFFVCVLLLVSFVSCCF